MLGHSGGLTCGLRSGRVCSPLAPTPSRPPPPDPTAEPARGFRGALPHRIAPCWGGTWPDGSGHYGQCRGGKRGRRSWKGGAVGGLAARAHVRSRDGGRASGSVPSAVPAAFGPLGGVNRDGCWGAPSFLGKPCKAPPSPVDVQRRGPSLASRTPVPGALVPGVPEGAAPTAQGRHPRREQELGGSRTVGSSGRHPLRTLAIGDLPSPPAPQVT